MAQQLGSKFSFLLKPKCPFCYNLFCHKSPHTNSLDFPPQFWFWWVLRLYLIHQPLRWVGVNNKERLNSTLKLPGCLHFFLYALGKKTLLGVSLSHRSPNMFKDNKWLYQSLQPLKGKFETWTWCWHVPVLDNIEELPYNECNISTFHSRCSHSVTLPPTFFLISTSS